MHDLLSALSAIVGAETRSRQRNAGNAYFRQERSVGGSVSVDGGIVLSLERMNRILDTDTRSMTMTVEAGCILQTVQEAAEAQEAFLPLDLGARGSAMIGGVITTMPAAIALCA